MDPEQLVAQVAALRTQNQPLHQALQQVQQQQSQQQGLVQALSDLPQSLAQTVGAAVLAAASPARTNPTLVKSTDSESVSLGTTYRELRRECVPWSERCLDVGRGKRIGNSDRSERSNRSCDASGHSANAGRSIVHSADDPCGRRFVRHPRWLWIWRRWRRLHKRWDPLTTGRARGLLREILSPGRAKLVELQGAWNDLRTC